MSVWNGVRRRLSIGSDAAAVAQQTVSPGSHHDGPTTERGYRPTPENQLLYQYRQMQVDYGLRAMVLDLREMDRLDGRVKKLHTRMARTSVKGGLLLSTTSENGRLLREWKLFERRLGLHRQEKLESDCRGLVMEGNLPLQWVLDGDRQVIAGVRMPSETIVPRVGQNGRFLSPAAAYEQYDLLSGRRVETFALWQLSVIRLSPDNFDDMGAMGRPYLDATRATWRKLAMTEEDLVIRRRQRAPLRMSHVLEGASQEDLEAYRASVEADAGDVTTDYYLNRRGGVTAVQGDAKLNEIADVVYLLDTFFSGGPAPKGLFGYTQDLPRDVLEDLKKDYFDEIDALQDTLAYGYELGFRLHLLLKGINPDNHVFQVCFAERRTDTANQRADLALKHQALGVPDEINWRTAGLDPLEVKQRRIAAAKEGDPYPDTVEDEDADDRPAGRRPRVAVTPGNARKGESATTISTRSS